MRKQFRYTFILSTLLTFCMPKFAYTEPMMPASWKELCNSHSVVLASVTNSSVKPSAFRKFFTDPPHIEFQITRLIHGEKLASKIMVPFDFHDGSTCVEPESWKFSESMLPKMGSVWMLFLDEGFQGIYRTYRGDFGRIPAGSLADFIVLQCEAFWEAPTKN